MRDTLYIGSSPPEEDCAQLGSDGYHDRARRECRAYINLLRRTLGPEPDGATLVVSSHPHDFGDYLAVSCRFNSELPEAIDYAYRCESDGPTCWDDQARQELSQPSTRKEQP
jgi:hypothetical protein